MKLIYFILGTNGVVLRISPFLMARPLFQMKTGFAKAGKSLGFSSFGLKMADGSGEKKLTMGQEGLLLGVGDERRGG
jgi:hypothetical protein